MTQTFSKRYAPLFTSKARYLLLWGGRARGGSFAATDYFLHRLTRPEYFRGFFMREVFGDVRDSLWRDFKDRIDDNETLNPKSIVLNESRMIAKCATTGNFILTKGFKKSSKARTGKLKSIAGATHVIIEEADEISEEDFRQLDDTLRSTKAKIQIILVFNAPPKQHWIWKRWFTLLDITAQDFNAMYGTAIDEEESTGYYRAVLRKDPKVCSIFSTFRDNLENINDLSIETYNEYQAIDPEHFYTMIEGLVSEGVRGRIFKNWKPITVMPGIWRKFYGLDWGFSNDPLALVEIEKHDKNLYCDQKLYATGMTNDDLDRELTRLGISKSSPIVADNAQPKDITDMKRKGWNFIPCIKGPGSVRSGITYLKTFDVYVTETSTDIWTEAQNYAYALDQYKNPTADPIDAYDHAIQAIIYAVERQRARIGGRIRVIKH